MTELSFLDVSKLINSVSKRFCGVIFCIHITDNDKTLKPALILEPGRYCRDLSKVRDHTSNTS